MLLTANGIFFPDVRHELFDSHKTRDDFRLTPEKIDYEMQFLQGQSTYLQIHYLTQQGLEHFVHHYASPYKVLYLTYNYVTDLSPLGDLPDLEAIRIDDCWQARSLWDFSRNDSLKVLSVSGSKKLVTNPMPLQTSHTLEEIRFWGGDFDNKYPLQSLSCFSGLSTLKRIDLNNIKLKEHNLDVLSTLPNLEQFHFDAGMLTTEEIAWICAKYPNLYGDCLGVYTTNDICLNDIRICGHRKPSLDLPRDQKKLDKYTAEFNALVEKYKAL